MIRVRVERNAPELNMGNSAFSRPHFFKWILRYQIGTSINFQLNQSVHMINSYRDQFNFNFQHTFAAPLPFTVATLHTETAISILLISIPSKLYARL